MTDALRIVIAAEAESDLQAIYQQRLGQRGASGPDGANALLDQLFEAIATLAGFSHRGPMPPELVTLGMADWHQVSVKPFRIIYTVVADVPTVAIVADGRRDFATLLERRLLQSPPRA